MYYKSDFDFLLGIDPTFRGGHPLTSCDFRVALTTSDSQYAQQYCAGKEGEAWTNCVADPSEEGAVRIIMAHHHLPPGQLRAEIAIRFPDPSYPDGYRQTVCRHVLDIELTEDGCDLGAEEQQSVTLTLPYVYASAYSQAVAAGYTGTEAEFTEALATMPQAVADANAATDGVKALAQAVDEAEQAREDAEGKRVVSENARRNSETSRTNAENARVSAEAARVEAEEGRAEAEQARELAETARANAEDGREGAESARQTAESQRAWNEDVRVAAENARVEAESERVEAETERVAEFKEMMRNPVTIDSEGNVSVYDIAAHEYKSAGTNVKGKSAYECAVDGGYAGTEEEFYADVSLVSDMAPKTPSGDPLHAMYERAGAVWNAETGYWELNGLTDITTAQMAEIWFETFPKSKDLDWSYAYVSSYIRTNLNSLAAGPGGQGYGDDFKLGAAFSNSKVEVVRLPYNCYPANISTAFSHCAKLKEIKGEIKIYRFSSAYRPFYGCTSLEEVRIYAHSRAVDFDFQYSPNLSMESLIYYVQSCKSTYTATITLHPTVYASALENETLTALLEERTGITLATV